jgi:sigma-B regulation protein RsbU (phosphoserine phosphatase)
MEPSPEPKRAGSAASRRAHLDKVFGTTEAAPARRLHSAVGRQLFEYVLEKPSTAEAASQGRILIVDHDRLSREILARNLQREGYAVEFEEDGAQALVRLREGNFDLALWEVQLPGLNGLDMLKRARKDPLLLHIPVVLLSEVKDAEMVIRCIEAGADDYLPKPFNPALLKARIRASMERKSLRDQEQRLLARIKAYQERISTELADATAYLTSLLPEPLREPFVADWRFIPSSELGGDTFGYHWIDEDHFALYLLDVCGHGVGAALLSVTALNVLRSHALNGVDFRNPSEVLHAANQLFPMERQNNRYFTLWYGVYQRSTRTLTYSSGGHPPALLFEPGAVAAKKLAARGMMVGGMPNSRYPSQSCEIPAGSRLFLFCDGVYEITLPDGRVYTLDEFAGLLGKLPADAPVDLDAVIAQIYQLRGSRELEDDLSLIAIHF